MAKKSITTNAMRLLTAAKIPFEAIEYQADEEMLKGDFGEAVAKLTEIPAEKSFKTLVARSDKKGILVCCIPVNQEADLKKIAKAANCKKIELIHVRELLDLTGYIRGGVSPIGMKKKYPTYIDESSLQFNKIAVSAGVCGCTLLLSPNDLIRITDGQVYDLIKDPLSL